MHPQLLEHSQRTGFDEMSNSLEGFMQPLVHQPGEQWRYGVSAIAAPSLARLTA